MKNILHVIIAAFITFFLVGCTGLSEDTIEEEAIDNLEAVLLLVQENRGADIAPDFNVDEFLYDYDQWESTELSEGELEEIRYTGEPHAYITKEEMIEDVETMHRVLKYMYALYEANGGDTTFKNARDDLIDTIHERFDSDDTIHAGALSQLLIEHYSFIRDTHFYIDGQLVTSVNYNLFISEQTSFNKTSNGYFFSTTDGAKLVSINEEENLEQFLKPSIDENGELVYTPSLFTEQNEPPTFQFITDMHGEKTEKDVTLNQVSSQRLMDDSKIIIDEEIPQLSLRTFMFYDHSPVSANIFIDSADKLQDEAVWILDIRSNEGGYSHYINEWHRELFGYLPGFGDYILTLYSNTGYHIYEDTEQYYESRGVVADPLSDFTGFSSILFPLDEPHWGREFYAEKNIKNEDSIIFVLIDEYTASAAEHMVQVMKQVENTILVGTPTMGALNSGGALFWELPNSNIVMDVPSTFNYHPEHMKKEGIGLEPDLWINPENAEERIKNFINIHFDQNEQDVK
ncbi:hypothetical protein LGQ02_03845 [Bacillus shivajii]|uniref:S41 family peptidase n=1 Tax=Bacillus shivajii TaxID=1983719 RepID=UPI001CF97272|nr:S41 family peptidase [Bacillus shivajii]UCZ53926.1 hypothetical protein LGQ02_03845 [Bacillus shivajii]